MTTPQENIIVDSCQYTPVYLIQTPGAIQVFFVALFITALFIARILSTLSFLFAGEILCGDSNFCRRTETCER